MSQHSSLTDFEVEAVLSGRATDPTLAPVATMMADLKVDARSATVEPPADLIAQAATLARESAPKPAVTRRPVRKTWRLAPAAVAASLALVMTAPLAAMANSAAPQDLLYPADRFFERIGIGDGGLAERLSEVETLHDRGEVDLAAHHLNESVGDATSAELTAHNSEVRTMANELTASGPDAAATVSLDEAIDRLPANSPSTNPGPSNPNQGPGNNSGSGNENPGQGNQGTTNPNQGSGNNSGSQGNQGTTNPNQGSGNNSGNQGNDSGNQGTPSPGGQGTQGNTNPGGQGNQGNSNSGNQGSQAENPNKGSGKNSGKP